MHIMQKSSARIGNHSGLSQKHENFDHKFLYCNTQNNSYVQSAYVYKQQFPILLINKKS